MMEELIELKEQYPFPECMDMFLEFIETYHTQLILLREQARVNGYGRLYEAIQNIFQDYGDYTKDNSLRDYPSLNVNGKYDTYLLHSLVNAATPVMYHYGELWKKSKGIPIDNTGVNFTPGIPGWGDASSGCSRLIGDIKRILEEDY